MTYDKIAKELKERGIKPRSGCLADSVDDLTCETSDGKEFMHFAFAE